MSFRIKFPSVILLFGLCSSVLLLGSAGQAKASNYWPQNGWGDGVNASIDIHKNINHNTNVPNDGELSVDIKAYVKGNKVGSSLSVSLVRDSTGAADDCNLRNYATRDSKLVIFERGYRDATKQEWGDCTGANGVPSTVSFTLNYGTYIAAIDKTEYTVVAQIVNPTRDTGTDKQKGNRYRFDMFSPDTNVDFGFSDNKRLYFSIDGAGPDNTKDIRIPICTSSAGVKEFRLYDPDNYAGDIQEGKLFDVSLTSLGVKQSAIGYNGSTGNSWFTYPSLFSSDTKYINRYLPFYGSNADAWISWTMTQDNKYYLKINNLGKSNYVALNMPAGVRGVCNGADTDKEWIIKADSSPSGVIYKGEKWTFSHKVYNEGNDTTDRVVVTEVVSAWDNLVVSDTGFHLPSGTIKDGSKTFDDEQTFSTTGTYTESVNANPDNSDDSDTNKKTLSTATVYVVAPKATTNVPEGYEKGTGGTVTIEHKIAIDPCPTTGYTKTVNWTISGIEGNGTEYREPLETILGNGKCEEVVERQVNGTWLDNKPVGAAAVFKSIAPAPFGESEGILSVFEVPFAKFYGNDIYATNGEIRFNDATSDPAYDGRGSVNQYAALAFGNVKIDTSSFRTIPIAAPNPPNGLDSQNSGTGIVRAKANTVHSAVISRLPVDCSVAAGDVNLAALSGAGVCRDTRGGAQTAITGSSNANKITIVGNNVIIGANSTNTTTWDVPVAPVTPPAANGVTTVYKHIQFNAAPWNTADAYAVTLTEGTYTKSQLQALGVLPNDLSSIKITSGYKVTLYDGDNFTGASKQLTDNVTDFRAGTIQWNDMTESIKVEKTSKRTIGISPPIIGGLGDRWTNSVTGGASPSVIGESATDVVPSFAAEPLPPEPSPAPVADEVLKNGGVLMIVAENIYIQRDVTRLDAILVASGSIHTCAEQTTPVKNGELNDKCRKALTINGAMSAQTINFQRVGGSRYLNESPGNEDINCFGKEGIQNCNRSGEMLMNSPKTAEVVNFPAYLYFTQPYLRDDSVPGGSVGAMYAAPPRL